MACYAADSLRSRGLFDSLLKKHIIASDETTFRQDILDWASRDQESLLYAQKHLRRLVDTLLVTPLAELDQRALELGVYFQITPALKNILGYAEVRGAYYSATAGKEQKTVRGASGRKFKARVDLFDVEHHRFPYEDGYFSTVLCCELLEHLKEDPMQMMTEINRVLPYGGYIVLTTPNVASIESFSRILAGYNPGFFPQYVQPSKDGSLDPRHSREYTPSEIRRLVEDAGFEVVDLRTGYYGDEEENLDGQAVAMLKSIGDDLSHRGPCIYCVAQKIGD